MTTRSVEQSVLKPSPADSSTTLASLVAEWRATRVKMGIATSATVMDVASKLGVDRGTAQRLNRVAKLTDVTPSEVGQFPGVRAWRQVLTGVERVLGADHTNYQTLSLACDHFAEWLRGTGGSRQAAARKAEAAGNPVVTPSGTARSRMVEACGEAFGYICDIRLDVQMVRESPDSSPPRLDLIMLNAAKGCHGTSAAMPLVFTRVDTPSIARKSSTNEPKTPGRFTSSKV